jgi:hypothetical protein
MTSPDAVVFALSEESPRQRWLSRERLWRVAVEVIEGDGVDLLVFGNTSNAGQPHAFANVRAPFVQRFEPSAVFDGLSYTLTRRPGASGPLLVRISGVRAG